MKSFAELSQRGQVARLRQMAMHALEHYDLKVVEVSLIQHVNNTLFRVDTLDKHPYVLRINVPKIRTLAEIGAEMMWLAALSRDTELHVPTPLATKTGDLVVTVETEGVPEPRHCVMFGWVAGRHLRKKLPKQVVHKMGESLALLHNHADSFVPPDGFWLKPLDLVDEFGKTFEDFGDDLFPAERRTIFRTANEKAIAELKRLYHHKMGLRVCHADLHLGNVKWHQGELQIFDFDDCRWAFPVQDIGISLYYLSYRPDFTQARQAFLAGYTSLRSLPEEYTGQLEVLMMAREMMVTNYILNSDNPILKQYIPQIMVGAEHRLRRLLLS